MLVLKTENLSKHFDRFKALSNLSLEVQQGDIYGFLGLNGAGKTTTLRLLLRLIAPSQGKIWILEQDFKRHHLAIMSRVGALVETPAFYSYLSGRVNLTLLARLGGYFKKDIITDLLTRVGLIDRADYKVNTYSQGMKQRLGIAQALLPCLLDQSSGPKLVMLDEPTNGLDPQGVVQIRNLIKQLHETHNVSFVISSHLLTEIELLCNRVGVIKQGQLVVQGTIPELLQRTTPSYVRLHVTPLDQTKKLIKQLSWVQELVVISESELKVKCNLSRLGELNAYLVQHNIKVSELTPERKGLEEFFMDKMK
ncbi:ABC transporter ATP-binding protein [Planctomycetota bacterium]